MEKGTRLLGLNPEKAIGGSTRELSFRRICLIVLAAVSSWACARYLHFPGEVIVWLLLFALEYFTLVALRLSAFHNHRGAFLTVILFTLAFTLSLVLGDHIVIEESGYGGLSDTSYISPYLLSDVLFFCLMLPGLFSVFALPIASLLSRREGVEHQQDKRKPRIEALGFVPVLALSICVFLGWIPYLVVYWPGFIFGDSLSSLNQALGRVDYSNHHPVAYTLYLKCWLKVAHMFGLSNTIGVGLSSLCQSLILSFSFGYLSRWVVVRGGFKALWSLPIALVFALTPYIATYGMALWKDPLFSVAVVLFTLCLADLVWSKGKIVHSSKAWIVLFVFSSLGIAFLRNNGIFLLAVCFVVALVLYLIRRKQEGSCGYACASGIMLSVLLVFFVIAGPVYTALHVVPSAKAESVGVPLNQMARVAALDGDMTESDREYLNSILPIDEYKSTYYPCCTDNLKWSDHFNDNALGSNMWEHWFSMLVRNPNAFFQAWELQTFGFWTVNTEQQAGWSWNISGGVPRNANPDFVGELANFDISSNPMALDEKWTALFPIDSWSVPIGWLFWLVVYLVCCLGISKRGSWLLFLMPSLILLGTLAIASPIYYWPRYGAALQFLIPFFLLLFVFLFRNARVFHPLFPKE